MSDTIASVPAAAKPRRTLTRAVIRFAGDSGDGMQVTGEQFTTEAAWAGNDISTLPNFPAEIRAPAGTPSACRASSSSSVASACTRPATSWTRSWP